LFECERTVRAVGREHIVYINKGRVKLTRNIETETVGIRIFLYMC